MRANQTAAPAITDAQRRFISSLAAEREYPVAGSTSVEAQILERLDDVLGQTKYVSRREASAVIDYLQARPRRAAQAAPVAGNDFRAMIQELRAMPKSCYIVDGDNGQPVHFEISEWRNRYYLNLMIGAPGAWRRQRTSVPVARALVAKAMRASYFDAVAGRQLVGPEAAAVRFSREFTVCAACRSPLSDAESIARGLGPVCAQRF